jgi:hypothetical protein
MSGMTQRERRRDRRYQLVQPVKIQCQLTGRYVAGRTLDLSRTGSRLWLDTPVLLVPGQRIRVAMGSATTALLRASQMVQATVVHSLGTGAGQQTAIFFDEPVPLAMTA